MSKKVNYSDSSIRNSLLFPGIAGFFERFSYYGVRTLLIIYLIHPDLNRATLLLGSTVLVGVLRPLGGFITDRFLGTRRSVLVANCLTILGTMLLYISLKKLLIPGIVCIILGSALFAPANMHILLRKQKDTHFQADSWMSIYFAFVSVGLFFGENSFTSITNESSLEKGMLFCLVSSICSIICTVIYRNEEKEQTIETQAVVKQINTPIIAGLFIAILLFWIATSLTNFNFSYHLTQHTSNSFADTITTFISLLAGFLFFFLWRYVSIPTIYKWVSGLILGGIVAFLPLLENDFYNTFWLNSSCITLLTFSEILTGALTYSLIKEFSSKKYLTTLIGTGLFFESVGAIIVYKWLPNLKLHSTTEIILSLAIYLLPAFVTIIVLYMIKKHNQSGSENQLIDQ